LGKEKGNKGVIFRAFSLFEHHKLLNGYNHLCEDMVNKYIFI